MERCHAESKTSTPGWDWLAEVTGLTRATVARIIRFLRKIGMLGLVAGGRQAQYTPASSTEFARWGNHGEAVADRAVYVLCEVLDDKARAEIKESNCKIDGFLSRFSKAVDVTATPIQKHSATTKPKAKELGTKAGLREYFQMVTDRFRQGEDRTDVHWAGNATTEAMDGAESRRNRLNAARTVQFNAPFLRAKSNRYVANILTPFFRNGWTANDVLHALDTMPDGTPRPHSGMSGVRNAGAVLNARLNDWRHKGSPVLSKSQRVLLATEEARERAIKVSVARTAPVVSQVNTEQQAQGIAALRALFM